MYIYIHVYIYIYIYWNYPVDTEKKTRLLPYIPYWIKPHLVPPKKHATFHSETLRIPKTWTWTFHQLEVHLVPVPQFGIAKRRHIGLGPGKIFTGNPWVLTIKDGSFL